MESITIDPEGDVYFQLAEVELRVSSKVLGLASSVWKAMFSPRFKEGTNLAQYGTCRIPLPDDNSDAMILICEVLHHKFCRTENPNQELLGEVALLVHKYDCVQAFRSWSTCQMVVLVHDENFQKSSRSLLLPHVFFFDHVSEFQAITRDMMYLSDIGPNYVVSDTFAARLPDGLFNKIHSKELKVKEDLLKELESIIDVRMDKEKAPVTRSHCSMEYFTECDGSLILEFIAKLRHIQLWPLNTTVPQISLCEILSKLKRAWPKPAKDKCTCSPRLSTIISELVKRAKGKLDGLCLDCVKYGESKGKRKCRVAHEGYLGLQSGSEGESESE